MSEEARGPSRGRGCWLAIDPGTKRIGVAVGDTSRRIATPLEIIPAAVAETLAVRLAQLADEYGATGLVVGWPLNMDDTEGPQAKDARKLAADLARLLALDVRLWDERLSSFTADQALAGLWTRKKRKALQDAVAAATILQDFLSCGGEDSAPKPADLPDP